MVVSVSILAAFPVFENISERLQNFAFKYFVPAAGETVQKYIQQFASQARQLTGTGIVFLLITAIMLMAAIEKGLNTIWHTTQHRALARRFIIYWSFLTLGPLLMGIGMVITSYVISMPFLAAPADVLGRRFDLLNLVPFLMESLIFTLLYLIVPNAPVGVRYAVGGGVAAAVLFEIAKLSFAFYIANFPTYEMIYGALSSIPIFLVWLYLSWTVVLSGAEFTYCLQAFRTAAEEVEALDVKNDFLLAYRMLKYLWEGQKSGRSIALEELAAREPEAGLLGVRRILELLRGSALVARDDQGNWLIARDLTHYTLLDLYCSHPFPLPRITPGLQANEDAIDPELLPLLEEIDQALEKAMASPLAVLFEKETEETV